MTEPATTTPPTKTKEPKAKNLRVIDTTAVPGSPPREHQQIVDGRVQTFKFEAGVPTELPAAIAAKFLRHDAFQLVDKDGKIVEYQRRPKQPDELGAGEKLRLAENETVARYDELSNTALLQRALELPGGEKFGMREEAPKRQELVDFIMKAHAERRKANASSDRDEGGYTPKAAAEADFEEEDAA